jgi:hypothetical protein
VGRVGSYARVMTASALNDFAAGLRGHGGALFSHGFAWGGPQQRPEGRRGVGFIDFASGRVHVVQIAVPRGVARRFESPTSPNPARRWFARALGRLTGKRNAPIELRFEHGRCEARRSPDEEWNPTAIPSPAWLVDLLDLPSGAVRLVGDRQTPSSERRVEVALDRAAVSEVAPRPLHSTVRHARAEDAAGELPFYLSFSPTGRPRGLSLSLGRTAHTSEGLWTAIEFFELGSGVADRDVWKAWELLESERTKGPP